MFVLGGALRAAGAVADGGRAWSEVLIEDALHPRRTFDGNDVDAWDPDHIRRILPVWRTSLRTYFRSEVRGLDNIPADGPCLLVGNHSGGVMIADTFVFATEFYDHFGPDRRFHQLAHDVVARFPGDRRAAVGYGRRLTRQRTSRVERGAPVLVYPGGDYETFRPSWHADQIEFGGRRGFIKLALEHDVPIVPVASVGGEETALFVTRGERAAEATRWADLTRIKVLPVAIGPPFGVSLLDLPARIPLPAKITIEVLAPIDLHDRFGAAAEHDEIYDEITGEMQDVLSELQDERTLPVVG